MPFHQEVADKIMDREARNEAALKEAQPQKKAEKKEPEKKEPKKKTTSTKPKKDHSKREDACSMGGQGYDPNGKGKGCAGNYTGKKFK